MDPRTERDWDKDDNEDVIPPSNEDDGEAIFADGDDRAGRNRNNSAHSIRHERRDVFDKKQKEFKERMHDIEKKSTDVASIVADKPVATSSGRGVVGIDAKEACLSTAESQLIEKLSNVNDLKSLFQKLDRNSDGVINREEFVAALTSLGVKLDPSYLNTFIDIFDADNNGKIDYADFQKFASFSPSKKHPLQIQQSCY